MTDYLIRTDSEKKKTHIVRLSDPNEIIGMIFTDFNLYQGIRYITLEDVVGSRNKTIARVNIFGERDFVSVEKDSRQLSAFSRDQRYYEDGVLTTHTKLSKIQLLQMPEYKDMERLGLTHAYILGNRSEISRVLCYEREGEISGIVTAKRDSDLAALKGLSLVLAQKVKDQDYVFEFMRNDIL